MNRLSRTLRTSVLAIAASAALAATGAWAQANPSADTAKPGPKAEQQQTPRHDHASRHGDPMKRMTEKLLQRVKATPEQRAQIQKIMETQGKDLASQHGQHRQHHEQMMALLSAPTIDAQAVEKLRRDGVAQHDQHSQKMTQLMVSVAQVLTPEQRQIVAKDLRDMAGRGGEPMMGHEHRGPHGHAEHGQRDGQGPADKPAGR